MLNGTIINVEILVGLPGSGKTYYATERYNDIQKNEYQGYYAKQKGKHSIYPVLIDFDKWRGNEKRPSLEDALGHHTYSDVFLCQSESAVICDGLFLTNKEQEEIVSEFARCFKKENDILSANTKIQFENKSKLNIKFVYFEEDREACLVNDSYREKSRSANATIKHAPLEMPDIEALRMKFNQDYITFEVMRKRIYKMTDYDGKFKTLRDDYWSKKLGKDVMVSERWSTGGTWGDYRGNEGTIEPDKAPQSFDEFDDLLEKICHGITFLKYKKIYNSCVTIEDDHENDYYGGTEYFECYCCDLKKLYDMLKEEDLINGD